jgi:hypothetical protein
VAPSMVNQDATCLRRKEPKGKRHSCSCRNVLGFFFCYSQV